MKKAIALATLMSVSVAQAQSSSELTFGDINYLFKSGEFNILADALLERREYKNDFTGLAKQTVESEGYVFDTRFTYGLMDNLNLFVGLEYQWDYEFNTEPRVNNANYTEDGLRNPEIGAIYRVMNQKDGGMNWDVGVVGRLSLMDAERGTFAGADSEDGNAATGNHALEVNTSIGKKWNEANEWRLTAGVIHNFDGETTFNSASGDVEVDTSSVQDFYARAAYQYRPVNEFMMAVALQVTQVGEREEEETNQGSTNETIDIDAHVDARLEYVAKYLITEDLMARFVYNHGILANYNVDGDQGTEYEVTRRREQSFGLGVDYRF